MLQHLVPQRFVLAGILAVVGSCLMTGTLLSSACSSGGGSLSASPTPAEAAPAASPTAGPTSASSAELSALLHQDADLPAGFAVKQNQQRPLHPGDTPGLAAEADGVFITLADAAGTEFVTEIAVVPKTGGAQSMLDAFTVDNYLAGFTGGASDATGQEAPLAAGAPGGAKAISYSGTAPGPNGTSRRVEGQSVALVSGRVFVVLIHATYAPTLPPLDLGSLATTIAGRLAGASDLD